MRSRDAVVQPPLEGRLHGLEGSMKTTPLNLNVAVAGVRAQQIVRQSGARRLGGVRWTAGRRPCWRSWSTPGLNYGASDIMTASMIGVT